MDEHSGEHTLRQELVGTVRIWRSKLWKRGLLTLTVFLPAVLAYNSFTAPAMREDFPKIITVPSGSTVRDTSRILQREGAIDAPLLFKDFVILFSGESGLKAGDYLFETPQSAYRAARRMSSQDDRMAEIRVTVPEGMSNAELAKLLENKLYSFDDTTFMKLAAVEEGYLFPDTYLFAPSTSPEAVIAAMKGNFNRKLQSVRTEITDSKRSVKDIIIMASLLEEEARTTETRRAVAGILWRRLSIGMPLQVDAVFPYIMGKNTYELTLEDLKADSPYNTYRYKGLPPGPISNPGIDSIRAAATPTSSTYLYYLTDSDGKMRYARTHEEHVANKRLYLR